MVGAGDAGQAAGMTETAAKLAKKAADQGVAVEVLEALAAIGGDLFAMTHVNAAPSHRQGATKIQSAHRGNSVRKNLNKKHETARRIQAIVRGFLTRLSLKMPSVSQAPKSRPMSRPGFEWLMRQMPASDREALRESRSFDRSRAVSRPRAKRPVDSSLPFAHVDTVGVVYARYSGSDPEQARAERNRRAQLALPDYYPPKTLPMVSPVEATEDVMVTD